MCVAISELSDTLNLQKTWACVLYYIYYSLQIVRPKWIPFKFVLIKDCGEIQRDCAFCNFFIYTAETGKQILELLLMFSNTYLYYIVVPHITTHLNIFHSPKDEEQYNLKKKKSTISYKQQILSFNVLFKEVPREDIF